MLKNTAIAIGAMALSYVMAELLYSSLVVNHFIKRRTYYFTEAAAPDGHIHFDPRIGYRMSSVPARYGAVVSDGRLQAMGTLVGNNYGLPDRRDFQPRRNDPSVFRVAVLGDSFTASQFTQRSWLQVFEDSLNRSLPDSFELLNFSVDGGGLANWHSILKNIMVKDSFDIDAVIYAVLGDDMSRKFHYRHEYLAGEEGNRSPMRSVGVGYHDNWHESSYPQSIEEAGMWFSDGWLVLTSEEIDAIESGKWKMAVPWRAYFLSEMVNGAYDLAQVLVSHAKAEDEQYPDTNRQQILLYMRQIHGDLNVPVLCFNLPGSVEQQKETEEFAQILGCDYLKEQHPVSDTDIDWDSLSIEGDGHWTQAGADFFARNNHGVLANWLEMNCLKRRE